MAFVTLEKKGPVGIVTMNRPEALNALDKQVLEDLNTVLDQVEADPEILVAIVTGAGRSFVAGADMKRPSSASPRWAWASPPASAAPSGWPGLWACPTLWS